MPGTSSACPRSIAYRFVSMRGFDTSGVQIHVSGDTPRYISQAKWPHPNRGARDDPRRSRRPVRTGAHQRRACGPAAFTVEKKHVRFRFASKDFR